MIFVETPLAGAYVIELEFIKDERGFFARTWCANEFEQQGLEATVVQSNLSMNYHKGTLRGMHYQLPPHDETKLVRCTAGSLIDQIVDVRPNSPTFKQSFGVELSAANHKALYVPSGFAHGYQTLEDNTEALYQVTNFYTPGAERGLRYNDPALDLSWPLDVTEVSAKDASWPLFETK